MKTYFNDKTVYATRINEIKNGLIIKPPGEIIKKKNFQIPFIEDRAFKHLCKLDSNIIINLLTITSKYANITLEQLDFTDTTLPNLKFNDKKMTTDTLFKFANNTYVNIEVNTSLNKSTLIKNIQYIYRLILSQERIGEELNSVNVIQVNIDLYSRKFMGGIINVYNLKNNLNGGIHPEAFTIIHIGLDKLFENPYNEDIDDWTRRFLNMLVSIDVKYTEELAGDYEDLKEVAKIMKEYSEDTSNLIYYNKKAMEESMRKTDLKFAKEEGISEGYNEGHAEGFNEGHAKGITEGINRGIKQGINQGEIKKSLEIAKKLLENDMSIEDISKITELSKEEILKLQDN